MLLNATAAAVAVHVKVKIVCTHPLVLEFDTINEVVLLAKFEAYQFTWKLFD